MGFKRLKINNTYKCRTDHKHKGMHVVMLGFCLV